MMADEEVSRLRARMLNAVEMDNQANEERRPATEKLMLLPIVTSTMRKYSAVPHDFLETSPHPR